MNFSDKTVSKVADVILDELSATQEGIAIDPKIVARAALSSLTLADLMQVVEVRALVEASKWMLGRIPEPIAIGLDEAGYPEYSNDIDHSNAWERHVLIKALTPFTEPKQ